MPVEHRMTVRTGTQGKTLLLYARDQTDPTRGKTGLTAADGTIAFVRQGEARAVAVPLCAGTPGSWGEGAFVEVDPRLMPGVYQLGVPDAALAPGATEVMLLARFEAARIEPVVVDLVAYDPQDGWRIGLESLANKERHAFLRQALPSFTERELALGESREQQLTRTLGEQGGK